MTCNGTFCVSATCAANRRAQLSAVLTSRCIQYTTDFPSEFNEIPLLVNMRVLSFSIHSGRLDLGTGMLVVTYVIVGVDDNARTVVVVVLLVVESKRKEIAVTECRRTEDHTIIPCRKRKKGTTVFWFCQQVMAESSSFVTLFSFVVSFLLLSQQSFDETHQRA